jgi:hypothetical protein
MTRHVSRVIRARRTRRKHKAHAGLFPLLPLAIASTASADALHPDALDAARSCYVEASFHARDCIEQLWVIRRRAERRGVAFADSLWSYSAIKRPTARALEVRMYPWGDVRGKPPRWNHKWARLRAEVAAWFRGERPSRYPRALHWGGRGDIVRAWEVIEGVEANRFSRRRTR